jgi:1-acyl-sn-glycerol-3-phosphate acyltransferase
MRHIRAIVRASVLTIWTLFVFAILVGGAPFAFRNRARWRALVFHKWARGSARILNLRIEVSGAPPTPPFLLVSNHLSYLDVVVYASQMSCVFVARSDLALWPAIGPLCRSAGTIFVNRESRRDVVRVNQLIDRAMARGLGVVLFAEGTSTGGDKVLPFKPSLLEHVARTGCGANYAALSYRAGDDEPPASESVCWWGDMTFVDHLVGLFHLRRITVTVSFGDDVIRAANRKELAERLWLGVRERLGSYVRARDQEVQQLDR